MGVLRNLVSGLTGNRPRNEFDGGRMRRRLKTWIPTQNTVNTILSSIG